MNIKRFGMFGVAVLFFFYFYDALPSLSGGFGLVI